MFSSFRHAMTWVHTWFGLVLGFVLMVVFFFGSLSVFDREIDRWAIPETRFEPQVMPSFDRVLLPIFEQIQPEEHELEEARARVGGPLEPELPLMNWSAYTTHRDPVLSMYAEFAVKNNPKDPDDHVHGHVTIDPRSGKHLSDDRLKIGSDFFYPMHISLHLHWLNIGYWIVGLAALIMLAALVSGVVMHRKFFREFFTFRPAKNRQRSTLDLHNLTGVVALPFHFMFPLTGLIIFAGIYFPVSETTLKPLAEKHEEIKARADGLHHDPAGVKAPLASVDAMVAEAKRRWAARDMPGEVGLLMVNHVGDRHGYVSVYRAGSDRVALVGQGVHFEAATGRVIREEPPPSAVSGVAEFLTGIHLQHFKHWLLRWLYVFGGLSGCACIATGLLFFVGKRKHKHAAHGAHGARVVDALAVTSTTGMVVATLAILVANRVLPLELEQRGAWEERVFWLTWLFTFVHAALRSAPVQRARLAPAWREQCYAIAGLAPAAVALNWITTGDHLGRTVARGYWPVAGLDLALLGAVAVALLAARRLRRVEAASAIEDEPSVPDARAVEVAHG
ncbi:PepSY domain-containing protein [Sorangium sp. So ce295]|uniref:PepSY domain-containing protein n=1 Tax=Sorangium sp. So ce295 TaxID=3133295 RepID=UPI003F5ED2D8